ncbi:MAG: glycosyltransferase [Sphingobacteriales bacterium]|nr:MAG: glycosyltransferase [Sphingobacteriales bacterium]
MIKITPAIFVKTQSLLLAFVLILACSTSVNAQINISLNDGWMFKKEHGTSEKINLPHTWNAFDVLDDEPGYYRGLGIYTRLLKLDDSFKGKEIALVFNGVAQEAEVLVNGQSAGKHIGSYTRFIVPITKFLNYKNDLIEVRANNRFNEDIPPLTADFTFFGGIYRNVSLLVTEAVHFSTGDHASSGVYISTPDVSAAKASVHVRSLIDNASSDNTSKVAIEEWSKHRLKNVDFEVIYESKSGLNHARFTGARYAKYDMLLFCDDDNWLAEDYLANAYYNLKSSPWIGIAGAGNAKAKYEIVPTPKWFINFQHFCCVYEMGEENKIDSKCDGSVFAAGAGMCIRKSLLLSYFKSQEKENFVLDRDRDQLTSGGDTDINYFAILKVLI